MRAGNGGESRLTKMMEKAWSELQIDLVTLTTQGERLTALADGHEIYIHNR